jgi:hypothetical protein
VIIKVKFTELTKNIPVKFKENTKLFNAKFGEVHTVTKLVGGEQFEGEYIVTPKVKEQTLPTKNKVLVEDMTIKAIPFFNVTNNSGGNTVYIGNEV